MWSFRGNACDIPTDCPHRERAGWTGDWQLFVPTAAYLYDVAGFSPKWLRDLAADQWEDGTVDNMAPMPAGRAAAASSSGSTARPAGATPSCWCRGSCTRSTATPRSSRELWPAMVRWLDRAERMAPRTRHPDRVARHPEPAAARAVPLGHRLPLGRVAGAGGEPDDFPAFIAADKADVATAFYAWSRGTRPRSPRVLGGDERGPPVRRAQPRTSSTRGARSSSTPTAACARHAGEPRARAGASTWSPTTLRQRPPTTSSRWSATAGTHLGTGFLATPDLLPVLADHGHLDLAYELLFQDTEPSWLVMIDRGATTMWERWDGIDEDGVPHESLNHYSKGAVISFLHRYVAGLQRLEPTWRRFRVAAAPGGGITWAATEHVSPHGRIEVRGRRRDRFRFDVTVPRGHERRGDVAGRPELTLGPGGHRL